MIVREPHTRATGNTPNFTRKINSLLPAHMGATRMVETSPTMAGENFGEFGRADSERAQREGGQLPSLHNPYFAPEADKVIAAGAEALAFTAMALMPKL